MTITKMLCIRKRQRKFVKLTSTVRRTAREEPIMYRKECSNSEEQFRRNVNNKNNKIKQNTK